MKNSAKKYPEIVLLDTTHKLLRTNLAVALFMVVDSNGNSEVTGVGLLTSERKQLQHWLLTSYKDAHDYPNVGCFMTDKDMKERDVIKEVFPGVPTYLCQWHVQQTFGRQFSKDKYYLPKQEKEEILQVLKSLVYSASP